MDAGTSQSAEMAPTKSAAFSISSEYNAQEVHSFTIFSVTKHGQLTIVAFNITKQSMALRAV